LMNEQALAFRSSAALSSASAGDDFLRSAEQVYRRLLESEPTHLRALCGLAVVRNQLGAAAEARDLLGKAASVAGQSAEGQAALGTAFRRISDLESARLHFETAVELDEEHRDARLQLANILCASGDLAAAVIQYEKVLELDPNSAEAHQNLALALQRLGRH